jgi:hypothetical protein
MVKDYTERLYILAAKSHEDLSRDGCGEYTPEPVEGANTQVGRNCRFPMFRWSARVD